MALLQLIGREQSFQLGQSTTIGRASSCGVVIADRFVSATHAEIRRTPEDRYLIMDLGSTHGTFVSGQKVLETVLSDGDEIRIGATLLMFKDQEQDQNQQSNLNLDVVAEATTPWIQDKLQLKQDTHFLPEQELTSDDDLRRNYEKLRAAYELVNAIGAKNDLDSLLECIVDTAFRLLPADRAVILLIDPKTGKPHPRIAKRRHSEAGQIVLSKSIIKEVIQQKNGFVLADAGKDARFEGAESIISQGIRSAMCVPMLVGNELVGIMHLDSQVANNAFGVKDLELFASIAVQAALAIKNVMLRRRIQDEAKARVQLQRFLSPSLVDQIIGGNLSLSKLGEVCEVTVLFADIRGFTKMSEDMEPPEVVSFLNEYFESVVEVLFRHGGTFDKYMGDGLMALFGFPLQTPNASQAAVACALEMQAEVEKLNQIREQKKLKRFAIGIGIHTGEALCGTIGSSKTMQYTAIGDTVNTASRLCALAGPDTVLVSESTLDTIETLYAYQKLPDTQLKGKSNPLKLYRVIEKK